MKVDKNRSSEDDQNAASYVSGKQILQYLTGNLNNW